MNCLLIDWFDEHGPKIWSHRANAWKRDSTIPGREDCAPRIPIFDVSNVAALIDVGTSLIQEAARKTGHILNTPVDVATVFQDAFPGARPPYQRIWVEYDCLENEDGDTAREGWNLRCRPATDEDAQLVGLGVDRPTGWDDSLLVEGRLYGNSKWTLGPVHIADASLWMSETGDIRGVDIQLADEYTPDEQPIAHNLAAYALETLCLSLSMMNARNIVQALEPRGRRNRSRKARHQLPLRDVRILRLDGKHVERRRSGGGESPGVPVRRHTYRGHWKEYGMRPGQGLLFGKYRCRVYVPDGARGAADLGIVDKRYVVVPWPKP